MNNYYKLLVAIFVSLYSLHSAELQNIPRSADSPGEFATIKDDDLLIKVKSITVERNGENKNAWHISRYRVENSNEQLLDQFELLLENSDEVRVKRALLRPLYILDATYNDGRLTLLSQSGVGLSIVSLSFADSTSHGYFVEHLQMAPPFGKDKLKIGEDDAITWTEDEGDKSVLFSRSNDKVFLNGKEHVHKFIENGVEFVIKEYAIFSGTLTKLAN